MAGHSIELPDLLKVGTTGIELDNSSFEWLVDHPGKVESKSLYISATEKRENKKVATQARYQTWQLAAKEYSRRNPKASLREISQYISKQPISAGKSADTIRKHIS